LTRNIANKRVSDYLYILATTSPTIRTSKFRT